MVYFIVISCSIYILSLFRGTQSHQCHWATVKCFYPLKIKPIIIIFCKEGIEKLRRETVMDDGTHILRDRTNTSTEKLMILLLKEGVWKEMDSSLKWPRFNIVSGQTTTDALRKERAVTVILLCPTEVVYT